MSIRSGILAVLTATDAYGLQLHGELEERTERVGRVNVGQIYSTLDRLVTAGLVRASGATDDGLPLYGLTDEGSAAAEAWLADASIDGADPWGDTTFKVLLATSLGHPAVPELLERYRAVWRREASDAAEGRSPGDLARRRLATAALDWLDDLEALPGGPAALVIPLRNERPRRGRRPATAPE
ncbi:PadR family transcriptional regulator [Herbiconiux sp. VKM Ac-2851]|uniref:PadR family transcriptional regulator n=1 Tax=Herbiconiux sp. VKM Ac-2851 TaxID=2739025 RepID=UPI001564C3AF|nr:PadR family transcriptional regulator [Herbiconiux sp. VKM Ac-2851]NQX33887.1 PadR family transcriptional regulator [Herbiconiux sp. VKM Ac-2851]